MKIKFIAIISLILSQLTLHSQTITLAELKSSATKASSGAFAELLISKGYTFIKRQNVEFGGYYSSFASNYNSVDDSWSSKIVIQSSNLVQFTFSDITKSNYNSLLNQIKTNYKKECFRYTDYVDNYITTYIVSDSVKIIVFTVKGENGYSDTYNIFVVKLFSAEEEIKFGTADRYNNVAWFNVCNYPSSK